MFSTEHYIPRGGQNHGTTQVCSVSGFPAAIADRNLKETALLIIETALTQTWGPPKKPTLSRSIIISYSPLASWGLSPAISDQST